MKHVVKFTQPLYGINETRQFENLEHPVLGMDPDGEDNIYTSEDPFEVILGSLAETTTYFPATRNYGTGSSYANTNSNEISLSKLQGDASGTYNLSLEPHILRLICICKPTDKDYLLVRGSVPDGLITVSDMVLPEGARYAVEGTIQGNLIFREDIGSLLEGWRLSLVALFSYPEGSSTENWDQVPRFTKGQQVRFNLTMKKPNGEVILDNKAITLNFT